MILLRDGAANDGVDELIALTCFVRLDFDLDVTVLAFTAGLTRVLGVLVGGTADGLAVGNLRGAHVGLHLELTQQAVDDDLQMELAHARDDGLAGLFVGIGFGRWGPPQPALPARCPSFPGRPWFSAQWPHG